MNHTIYLIMSKNNFRGDEDHRSSQTPKSSTDGTAPKKVEGLEDVLRKQKARGPKKDEWADFEEPIKGRKMTCWRCGYQGKTADSEWDLGGFREVKCPRCAAKGTVPLRMTTRVSYYLGAIVFLLLSIFALRNGVLMLAHNMSFGGLAVATAPVMLWFVCINALAKDKSIRSAKKK